MGNDSEHSGVPAKKPLPDPATQQAMDYAKQVAKLYNSAAGPQKKKDQLEAAQAYEDHPKNTTTAKIFRRIFEDTTGVDLDTGEKLARARKPMTWFYSRGRRYEVNELSNDPGPAAKDSETYLFDWYRGATQRKKQVLRTKYGDNIPKDAPDVKEYNDKVAQFQSKFRGERDLLKELDPDELTLTKPTPPKVLKYLQVEPSPFQAALEALKNKKANIDAMSTNTPEGLQARKAAAVQYTRDKTHLKNTNVKEYNEYVRINPDALDLTPVVRQAAAQRVTAVPPPTGPAPPSRGSGPAGVSNPATPGGLRGPQKPVMAPHTDQGNGGLAPGSPASKEAARQEAETAARAYNDAAQDGQQNTKLKSAREQYWAKVDAGKQAEADEFARTFNKSIQGTTPGVDIVKMGRLSPPPLRPPAPPPSVPQVPVSQPTVQSNASNASENPIGDNATRGPRKASPGTRMTADSAAQRMNDLTGAAQRAKTARDAAKANLATVEEKYYASQASEADVTAAQARLNQAQNNYRMAANDFNSYKRYIPPELLQDPKIRAAFDHFNTAASSSRTLTAESASQQVDTLTQTVIRRKAVRAAAEEAVTSAERQYDKTPTPEAKAAVEAAKEKLARANEGVRTAGNDFSALKQMVRATKNPSIVDALRPKFDHYDEVAGSGRKGAVQITSYTEADAPARLEMARKEIAKRRDTYAGDVADVQKKQKALEDMQAMQKAGTRDGKDVAWARQNLMAAKEKALLSKRNADNYLTSLKNDPTIYNQVGSAAQTDLDTITSTKPGAKTAGAPGNGNGNGSGTSSARVADASDGSTVRSVKFGKPQGGTVALNSPSASIPGGAGNSGSGGGPDDDHDNKKDKSTTSRPAPTTDPSEIKDLHLRAQVKADVKALRRGKMKDADIVDAWEHLEEERVDLEHSLKSPPSDQTPEERAAKEAALKDIQTARRVFFENVPPDARQRIGKEGAEYLDELSDKALQRLSDSDLSQAERERLAAARNNLVTQSNHIRAGNWLGDEQETAVPPLRTLSADASADMVKHRFARQFIDDDRMLNDSSVDPRTRAKHMAARKIEYQRMQKQFEAMAADPSLPKAERDASTNAAKALRMLQQSMNENAPPDVLHRLFKVTQEATGSLIDTTHKNMEAQYSRSRDKSLTEGERAEAGKQAQALQGELTDLKEMYRSQTPSDDFLDRLMADGGGTDGPGIGNGMARTATVSGTDTAIAGGGTAVATTTTTVDTGKAATLLRGGGSVALEHLTVLGIPFAADDVKKGTYYQFENANANARLQHAKQMAADAHARAQKAEVAAETAEKSHAADAAELREKAERLKHDATSADGLVNEIRGWKDKVIAAHTAEDRAHAADKKLSDLQQAVNATMASQRRQVPDTPELIAARKAAAQADAEAAQLRGDEHNTAVSIQNHLDGGLGAQVNGAYDALFRKGGLIDQAHAADKAYDTAKKEFDPLGKYGWMSTASEAEKAQAQAHLQALHLAKLKADGARDVAAAKYDELQAAYYDQYQVLSNDPKDKHNAKKLRDDAEKYRTASRDELTQAAVMAGQVGTYGKLAEATANLEADRQLLAQEQTSLQQAEAMLQQKQQEMESARAKDSDTLGDGKDNWGAGWNGVSFEELAKHYALAHMDADDAQEIVNILQPLMTERAQMVKADQLDVDALKKLLDAQKHGDRKASAAAQHTVTTVEQLLQTERGNMQKAEAPYSHLVDLQNAYAMAKGIFLAEQAVDPKGSAHPDANDAALVAKAWEYYKFAYDHPYDLRKPDEIAKDNALLQKQADARAKEIDKLMKDARNHPDALDLQEAAEKAKKAAEERHTQEALAEDDRKMQSDSDWNAMLVRYGLDNISFGPADNQGDNNAPAAPAGGQPAPQGAAPATGQPAAPAGGGKPAPHGAPAGGGAAGGGNPAASSHATVVQDRVELDPNPQLDNTPGIDKLLSMMVRPQEDDGGFQKLEAQQPKQPKLSQRWPDLNHLFQPRPMPHSAPAPVPHGPHGETIMHFLTHGKDSYGYYGIDSKPDTHGNNHLRFFNTDQNGKAIDHSKDRSDAGSITPSHTPMKSNPNDTQLG